MLQIGYQNYPIFFQLARKFLHLLLVQTRCMPWTPWSLCNPMLFLLSFQVQCAPYQDEDVPTESGTNCTGVLFDAQYAKTKSPRLDTESLGHRIRKHPITHAILPGSWRMTTRQLTVLERPGGNHVTKAGKACHEHLCEYSNSSSGAVSWQDKMV